MAVELAMPVEGDPVVHLKGIPTFAAVSQVAITRLAGLVASNRLCAPQRAALGAVLTVPAVALTGKA